MTAALALVPSAAQPGAGAVLTIHISLGDAPLPDAALRLIESLHALATMPGGTARPEPAGGQRPRLVRGPTDGPALRLDLAARTVLCAGAPVRLTRREFDLFAFLARNPRRVFRRAHLLAQVWGYEMVSGERTVDVHVRRLRAKLGGTVVATVRGVGYRLDEATRVTLTGDDTG
jgi:two-component system OmpR family response regulator